MLAKYLSLVIALLGLLAAFFPAFPDAVATDETDETDDQIVLRSVEIFTTIDNAYAVTEITYSYENTGNETGEAFFSLSIPEKAFISNFSLTLENNTYYADVLTKDEAREKYDDAVASGKTAGIGEQRDTKLFSFAVNINGSRTAKASLRYEQYIPRYLGERVYSLFLSSMDIHPETFDLSVDISSMTGITGLTVENYADSVQETWDSTHHLTLTTSSDAPELLDDLVVRFSDESRPINGSLLGYYDKASNEYYFLNIFSPGKSDIGGGFSKDIIFVLDKSGSMRSNKMSQLKVAFGEILDQLSADDRFNIIMFDSNYHLYKYELIGASDSNKNDAKDYLNGQPAEGSTNLYDGLEQALNMLTITESRVPIIVMLTDGQANHGTYTSAYPIREHIREENTIFCPIFSLGFGSDRDVDFDFLTALSLENYAQAKLIHPGEDAGEQIVNFYETISTTLLKRIEIDYGDKAYDHFPESIPALYEGSEAVIVGKFILNGTDDTLTTTFTAQTPEGNKDFTTDYSVGTGDTQHDSVKRFWAYARIYHLMDELTMKSGEEYDQIISEIENLSIEAHFVTPYTSLYLEIEEEEESSADTEGDGDNDRESDTKYSSSSGSSNSANSYNSPKQTGGGSLGVSPSSPPANSSDKDEGGLAGGSSCSLGAIPTILAFAAVTLLIFSIKIVNRKRNQ